MSTAGGAAESLTLIHETVAVLEMNATHIVHDTSYLYAACSDQRVRVISREDWQIKAVLGETSSEPLSVHVDDEHIYATCEKRVYVWKKETWGMLGWFELSYQAVTSTLRGDYLYVGAKEGRLVAIKKDTHETSSWQLHKTDITTLWSDETHICTGTKKSVPTVWSHKKNNQPEELHVLNQKIKGAIVTGNEDYIIAGVSADAIHVWDRIDWKLVQTFSSDTSDPLTGLWANEHFVVASINSNYIGVWDIKRSMFIGKVKVNGYKANDIDAAGKHVFLASDDGLVILELLLNELTLDLSTPEAHDLGVSLLKTSPYDVLEEVLKLRNKGDKLVQNDEFLEAVTAFEKALQLLIDNTSVLNEVPEERQKMMNEINSRLGTALLKTKISEIQRLDAEIEQISDELDLTGRTVRDDEAVDKLWEEASRAIKESRVLAEAQAGNILSYQLSFVTDNLENDLEDAREKMAQYREKINQALALTHSIDSEWRWMERRRTSLNERKSFLEGAISQLEDRLDEAEEEDEEEVKQIISTAIAEHRRVLDQISRILSASESDDELQSTLDSRDEALDAISGLLSVMPKKRMAMLQMKNPEEQKLELERLISAIQQALQTARKHKLKEEVIQLQNEMNGINSLYEDIVGKIEDESAEETTTTKKEKVA
ncbi:MAG: hypothetical protein BAJATHORv1_40274 [Candidatus Thorarchaeota archaeon]|nr:MAG: hypothetical protein BAJATHORv1_40274 [Candidatus Thorarchaeota archaeon]